MKVLRFDRERLRSELSRLSPQLRVAFAALCARRLMRPPGPQLVDLSSSEFKELHSQLWTAVVDPPSRTEALTAAADRALALLPEEGTQSDSSENAISALTYALRAAANGDLNDPAWAAEHVYNAIDAFLIHRGARFNSADDEELLLRHPLIQAELQRQANDLATLSSEPSTGMLDTLRQRADSDAMRIFG